MVTHEEINRIRAVVLEDGIIYIVLAVLLRKCLEWALERLYADEANSNSNSQNSKEIRHEHNP